MKNYTLFIFLNLIVASCSSIKEGNKIAESFIIEKMDNNKNIFLINKSLPKNKSLMIYEKLYNERDLEYYLNNHLKENNDWPIKKKEILELKNKYQNDTISNYWKKTDFNSSKIKILEYNKKFNENEINEYLYNASKGYKITPPILFSNNKYALIYFISHEIMFGNSTGSLYILKKEGRKWIIINEYFDKIYN
jgi:hypothetical protein